MKTYTTRVFQFNYPDTWTVRDEMKEEDLLLVALMRNDYRYICHFNAFLNFAKNATNKADRESILKRNIESIWEDKLELRIIERYNIDIATTSGHLEHYYFVNPRGDIKVEKIGIYFIKNYHLFSLDFSATVNSFSDTVLDKIFNEIRVFIDSLLIFRSTSQTNQNKPLKQTTTATNKYTNQFNMFNIQKEQLNREYLDQDEYFDPEDYRDLEEYLNPIEYRSLECLNPEDLSPEYLNLKPSNQTKQKKQKQ